MRLFETRIQAVNGCIAKNLSLRPERNKVLSLELKCGISPEMKNFKKVCCIWSNISLVYISSGLQCWQHLINSLTNQVEQEFPWHGWPNCGSSLALLECSFFCSLVRTEMTRRGENWQITNPVLEPGTRKIAYKVCPQSKSEFSLHSRYADIPSGVFVVKNLIVCC